MEKKPQCRICDDIGFYKGKVCVCIAGPKSDDNVKSSDDMPDFLKDLFGVFDRKK
jgi:hypothetical protein